MRQSFKELFFKKQDWLFAFLIYQNIGEVVKFAHDHMAVFAQPWAKVSNKLNWEKKNYDTSLKMESFTFLNVDVD